MFQWKAMCFVLLFIEDSMDSGYSLQDKTKHVGGVYWSRLIKKKIGVLVVVPWAYEKKEDQPVGYC